MSAQPTATRRARQHLARRVHHRPPIEHAGRLRLRRRHRIDIEDDLGLESSTYVARLGGYFWLGRRHRLDGAYFDLSRTASIPIEETIEFGDETFVDQQRHRDGVGPHDNEGRLHVRGRRARPRLARRDGWPLCRRERHCRSAKRTLGRAETEDLTAPLPLFGLRGDFAVSDRITLRGAAQLFAFETDDVDGRLTDFYFGADYGFGQRMAVGLAYNRVSMNLGAEEETASTAASTGATTACCCISSSISARARATERGPPIGERAACSELVAERRDDAVVGRLPCRRRIAVVALVERDIEEQVADDLAPQADVQVPRCRPDSVRLG